MRARALERDEPADALGDLAKNRATVRCRQGTRLSAVPTSAMPRTVIASGSYIAPHQSGGPVATAVCPT